MLCNTPFYDAALVRALNQNGLEAELAAPRFYLEPDYLDPYPRAPWIVDLTVHLSHPRAVRLGSRAIELPINFARLRRAVRTGDYQIVHVEWIPLQERQTTMMSILRSACDHAGIPLVLTVHNVLPHDTPGASREMIRHNLDLAHLLIALTDHVAQELVDTLETKTPVETVPHGIMFADSELPSKDQAVARLGLQGDPVVLFAGLIRPYKGIDLLADAWPIIRAAFPDATLLVVGRALGDEARDQLKILAEMPGVRTTGGYVPMQTMIDSHAASDMVVFPYKAISQSAALMSAVGLGRPSVCTPLAGFEEQADSLASVTFTTAITGDAIAEATIAALVDRGARLAAAMDDRHRVAASPQGWPSVGRATVQAYERAIAGLR
jgi:glycosyltransferase involved in cell wall biosynthesis